jgi:hypothetical protein
MPFTLTSDPLANPCAHLLLISLGALVAIVLTSTIDCRSGRTTVTQSEVGAVPMPVTDGSRNSVIGEARHEPGTESPANKAQVGSPSRERARRPVPPSPRGQTRGIRRR